jgi:hypothetical protein
MVQGHSRTLAQARQPYHVSVSRRYPAHNQTPESRLELTLTELCSKLGYCNPPDEREAILADPPPDAKALLDAM